MSFLLRALSRPWLIKKTEVTTVGFVSLYDPGPWLLGCVREIENAF